MRQLSILFMCLQVAVCASTTAEPLRLDRNPTVSVMNEVFSTNVTIKPYHLQITARYADEGVQIALVIYPGGDCEVFRSSIDNLGKRQLRSMIYEAIGKEPSISGREYADSVSVTKSSVSIRYDQIKPLLDRLRAIKISAALSTRAALDDASEFELWYDAGQEAVHYTLYGPFDTAPQDKLVQWMIRFRTEVVSVIEQKSTTP